MKQSDSQLFTYKDNRTSYNIKNATFTYKIRDLRTSRQVCLAVSFPVRLFKVHIVPMKRRGRGGCHLQTNEDW